MKSNLVHLYYIHVFHLTYIHSNTNKSALYPIPIQTCVSFGRFCHLARQKKSSMTHKKIFAKKKRGQIHQISGENILELPYLDNMFQHVAEI